MDRRSAATFDDPKAETEARRQFLASNVGIGIDLSSGEALSTSSSKPTRADWSIVEFCAAVPIGLSKQSDSPFRFRRSLLRSRGALGSGLFFVVRDRLQSRISPPARNRRDSGSVDRSRDIRLFKQVALADPTKSGSAAKTFEMIIQQQIQEAVPLPERPDSRAERISESGSAQGLPDHPSVEPMPATSQARASSLPVDVSLGEAAMGCVLTFMDDSRTRPFA